MNLNIFINNVNILWQDICISNKLSRLNLINMRLRSTRHDLIYLKLCHENWEFLLIKKKISSGREGNYPLDSYLVGKSL